MYDSSHLPATLRYRPLVLVALFAVVGIVGDRLAAPPAWLLASGSLLLLATWWVCWSQGRERAAAVVLLLAVCVTAGAWHHQRWQDFASDEIGLMAREDSQPVCIEAIALETPEHLPAPPADALRSLPQGQSSRVPLLLVAVRNGQSWQAVSGRASLSVEGQVVGVQAGDRLRVFGQLTAPAPAVNPGEFDWAQHQRSERMLASVWAGFPDCIEVLASQEYGPRGALAAVRGYCRDCLRRYLPGDQYELASAVILGDRAELGRDRSEQFFETGTVHLLVVSGLHVGLMALFVLLLGKVGLLPWRFAVRAAVCVALAYAVIAGFRPPAIRAALLVTVAGLAFLGARRVDRTSALALAALAVLAWNPTELFRSGAQLSFLAVATLMQFGGRVRREVDPLDRLIDQSRAWPVRAFKDIGGWVGRMTWMSAAIWLVALPLVLYQFHLFTPLGILLTPLLWIPITLALGSGLVVIAAGWILPPVAGLAGWVCGGCLAFTEWAVGIAHEITWARLWLAGPSLWWVVGFYAILAWLMLAVQWRPSRRWCIAMIASWIAIGAGTSLVGAAPWRSPESRGLTAGFVDVGHGTSVVVELPDGRTLLYDAGRLGTPEGGVRAISAYLWSRGISHIDAVVLSHADLDHYNALPGLLERFSVGVVYVSPMMFEENYHESGSYPPGYWSDPAHFDRDSPPPDPNPALTTLRQAIESHGVPLEELVAGDRLAGGPGVLIEALHPPAVGVVGSDNANSIVLAIEYEGRRVLLPGDLESPGLDDLLAELPLDCDVIMAPHHGSARSNPVGLAEWSTPEWVVVSGGHVGDAQEVTAAYKAAGARVLHTAKCGAVTVTIEGEALRVESFRTPRAPEE